MKDLFLKSRLDKAGRRFRAFAFWRMLAMCWAGAAVVGGLVVLAARSQGWTLPGAVLLMGILTIGVAAFLGITHRMRPTDYRRLAQRIEKRFPSLQGVLLTAVEDEDSSPNGADFLRYRVVRDAISHSQEQDWRRVTPLWRLAAVHVVHAAAAVCFVAVLTGLGSIDRAPATKARNTLLLEDGIVVTPGDISLERGEALVVLAQFGRAVPSAVSLLIEEDGAPPRAISLARNLGDPVFGGSVPNVERGFRYQLQYDERRTREFHVSVFEHPRLVRADVDLTYPEYTRLAPKHIEDTRRFSAVEGTRIDLALNLNKPVKSVRLVGRDGLKTAYVLEPVPGQPAARRSAWIPEKGGTFDLELIDEDGRRNKQAFPFVVDLQPNRVPDVRLTMPRGDVRPSALEEVSFDGTVWDDFGTLAFGLAYSVGGAELRSVPIGSNVPAREKKPFKYVLDFESLGAKPDDLVSWHVWAEDIGPDGKLRRTTGDLFFAEIRPFDEVFRESQGMASEDESERQQQGQGGAGRRLTEIQKQIISATWKLQRDGQSPTYATDLAVVREAQQNAKEQATEAAQQVRSPREQGLWQSVLREMSTAVEKLAESETVPVRLAQALPPEQGAYQALLKLQARETSVTRGQRSRNSGSQSQAGNQRQLNQLDLQQSENRYETQRQARAPQNPQQREQVEVMNRLQDLARRQQDLNERLQELQTALQEARDETQREELRRRLKRLEEEQRQMLADTDELRQRMNRGENQSELSQQRQELDQARDALQQAADAAAQGTVAQALASGTRAQRQLQQARDEIRQQSSSQFADELRQMRGEARELSHRQEELEQQIASSGARERARKSLSDAGENPALAEQVRQQRERWNRLFDRAREISEQAETSEPLVSRELYDSVRKASQADSASVSELQQELLGSGQLTFDLQERLAQATQSAEPGKALDLAGEMLRAGNTEAAGQSARRAGAQVEELRRGVERAAESVLGDDTEQLRLARSELEALADDLQREMTRERGPDAGQDRRPGQLASDEPRQETTREPGQRPSQGEPGRTADAGSAADSRRTAADEQQRKQQSERSSGQLSGERVADRGSKSGDPSNGRSAEPPRGGDRSGRLSIDSLLNEGGPENGSGGGGGGRGVTGPLTGDDFGPWADRLRDVEQLLDTPELRDAVAAARERARGVRREFTQNRAKPDWAVVQSQVVKPLVEVRNRVAEELARRGNRESLAPIDHDPVPTRFAESVRKYYEELGKDRSKVAPQ